jgi:hypothetical protein
MAKSPVAEEQAKEPEVHRGHFEQHSLHDRPVETPAQREGHQQPDEVRRKCL